uniref:Uncharacterized protein n=1 Tax=Cacopsylla melanoneura TaxID=428564 RepID=A0A8D9B1F0_9HEMI
MAKSVTNFFLHVNFHKQTETKGRFWYYHNESRRSYGHTAKRCQIIFTRTSNTIGLAPQVATLIFLITRLWLGFLGKIIWSRLVAQFFFLGYEQCVGSKLFLLLAEVSRYTFY